MFYTLGIETSCDETSVSILKDEREILSNIIFSQSKLHKEFGGVVPEIAARKHTEVINIVLEEAMKESSIDFEQLNLVAVTVGPGLAVSLTIGIAMAKVIAQCLKIPAVGVNHLEGHICANFLSVEHKPVFPSICLLVSGGHTNLIYINSLGKYKNIGSTVDDAAGEVIDKIARFLNLGYPGGPVIEKTAVNGNPNAIYFPRPMLSKEISKIFENNKSHKTKKTSFISDKNMNAPEQENLNFSFSGLKTAVINFAKSNSDVLPIADIAASFQESIVDVLVKKTIYAAMMYGIKHIYLAGGVACNTSLRERLSSLCKQKRMTFHAPNKTLCTDNAGMIACAGYYNFKLNDNLLFLLPQPNLNI